MFDSIFIGTSGLVGYSQGLRAVSNNLANVNTPGFKGAQVQFADLLYEGTASQPQNFEGGNAQTGTQLGSGLNVLGTEISFRDGTPQASGNDLDLAISGNGFFVLQNDDQPAQFTRAGSFAFDDGFLVSRTGGGRVQGFDSSGNLGDISLNSLLTSSPNATSSVKFNNVINRDATSNVLLNAVPLFDQAGGMRNVSLSFARNMAPPLDSLTVTVMDGPTTVGTGNIRFNPDGSIMPAFSKFSVMYTPPNGTALPVELDFTNARFQSIGLTTPSTVAVESQNGFSVGSLSTLTFDNNGRLNATYSNGQIASGPTVALAKFESNRDLNQLGGNLFGVSDTSKVEIGRANTSSFGRLSPRTIEGSNVDLAQEFSNLIVMQRGFQASSRVVSTANELIQELFDLKDRN
jgi:flagellar hook protein FlgE